MEKLTKPWVINHTPSCAATGLQLVCKCLQLSFNLVCNRSAVSWGSTGSRELVQVSAAGMQLVCNRSASASNWSTAGLQMVCNCECGSTVCRYSTKNKIHRPNFAHRVSCSIKSTSSLVRNRSLAITKSKLFFSTSSSLLGGNRHYNSNPIVITLHN